MANHLRIHLQGEIPKDVIIDLQCPLHSGYYSSSCPEVHIDVIAISLFLDGKSQSTGPPFFHVNDLAAVFRDIGRDAPYQILNLIIANDGVDDIRQFVGILLYRHEIPSD